MGPFIFLLIVICLVVYFVRKSSNASTEAHETQSPAPSVPPPPPSPYDFVTRGNEGTPARKNLRGTAIQGFKEILDREPNLKLSDPVVYQRTHMSLAVLCADELAETDIGQAVDRTTLTWRDQAMAEKIRKLSDLGIEHGEAYCEFAGDAAIDEVVDRMASLYTTAATAGRLDRDYKKAFICNSKRLQFEKDPDDLSDRAIEGMFADASHAGEAAAMLTVFSDLADQKPEWERLTPRIRKILATD